MDARGETGVEWVKLYTDLPDDDKLVEAGNGDGWHLHLALYVAGLCYCGAKETDGRIPKPQVPRLTTIPDVNGIAADLVRVGLWHDRGDHYEVHNYTERQVTKAEYEATRRKRSEAGKKGAARRWAPEGNGSGHSTSHNSSHGKSHSASHGESHGTGYGSSSLISSSLEGTSHPVEADRRARARGEADNELRATVRDVITILNRAQTTAPRLTDLDDARVESALAAHPSVDPRQAAHAAVAKCRPNQGRLDALVWQLRALETRQRKEREREQHKPDPAVVHKLATHCRECGRPLTKPSDRASGTCQQCDERRLEGAA